MPTTSGFRNWLGHRSTKWAIALTIVGILFMLLELQNPASLYWTGQAVEGADREGIVYYQVHGEQYTLDDQRQTFADGEKVTVYFDPGDPSHALLPSPTRWIDATVVLIWFVAVPVVLTISALRRRSSPPSPLPPWP